MIILPGLGVLGVITALSIPLSVTVCPPPAQSSFFGRKKGAGTQGEFGRMQQMIQERRVK